MGFKKSTAKNTDIRYHPRLVELIDVIKGCITTHKPEKKKKVRESFSSYCICLSEGLYILHYLDTQDEAMKVQLN